LHSPSARDAAPSHADVKSNFVAPPVGMLAPQLKSK
jgi:hypothetical protein